MNDKELKKRIESSKSIEIVYKEIAKMDGFGTPSEILQSIQETTAMSPANFHETLDQMYEEEIVEKPESTEFDDVYELTDSAKNAYKELYGEPLIDREQIISSSESEKLEEPNGNEEIESQNLAKSLSDNYVIIDTETYRAFRTLIEEGDYEKAEKVADSYTEEDSLTEELLNDIIEDNKTIDGLKTVLE